MHATVLSAIPLLSLLITGCATAQAAPQEDAIPGVYTAVARTVSAASASPSSTATLEASSTATGLPSTSTPSPTSTPTSGVVYAYSSGCNNAAYLSDVTVPDGEDMVPGGTFTKTWELLNTGSCPWNRDYSVVLVDGPDMAATAAYLDTTVAVGVSGDVSVELTAPEDEGTYTAYWRLADASGKLFGEQFYVQIVVTGDAATPTPTPTTQTVAPSATATTTPTATSATNTLEPTAATEFTSTPTSEGITGSPTETPNDKKIGT